MPEPVRDFLATDDDEWAIVNGDFAQVAGADAIPQGIRNRITHFKEEAFLDEDAGVDFDVIMTKGTDRLLVRALLQAEILKTPDVTAAVGAEVVFDGATREASIEFAVETTYSEETLLGQAEIP